MYLRIFTFTFLSIAFLLCLVNVFAYGQIGSTTGAIKGSVLDEQKAVITGATITVKHLSTNIVREIRSNENGDYSLLQLLPGDYELKTVADGFLEQIERVNITLGSIVKIESVLKVTGTNDAILIKSHRAYFEDRTENSTSIVQNQIESLPINRRNFLDFSLTSAGVTPDGVPATGVASTSGLSFNGQSGRNNNISIDGLDNNEIGNGIARTNISQDAVQEFQVVGANSSAEFGRAIGGVVNIITKSGTNEYHGSIFNFIRNEKISAKNAFSPFNPEFRQYQFGSTLGGPIKQDKSFFFLSFERLSLKQNNIVTISNVAANAARKLGFDVVTGPIPFSEGLTTLFSRFDFQLTPNNRLTSRYNYSGQYNGAFQTFGGLRDASAAGILDITDNTIAFTNTYINTRLNLINETRFIFTNRDQRLRPVDLGGPSVNIFAPEGIINFGRDPLLPQSSLSKYYNIVNNITFSRGKHQLKTGVDVYSINGEVSLAVLFSGLAVFSPLDFSQALNIPGLPSFTALEFFDPALRSSSQLAFLQTASALLPGMFPGFPANVPLAQLPIPISYLQGFGPSKTPFSYNYVSGYVQDDFRFRPNLLFKIGLRYDRESIRFAPKNNGNFSPRIGIFYSPFNNQHLSFFASYGIYHGVTQYAPATVTQLINAKTTNTPVLPFPFSVIPFSLVNHQFPESSSLPQEIQLIPQLTRDVELSKTLKNGYAQQVNAGVNYLFNDSFGVSLNYQMVRGLKVFLARNTNPVIRPLTNDPIKSQILGRVDPTRGEVISFETAGDSYYNAGTITFFVRTPNQFSFLAHYTVSKTIDNYIDALRFDILELQNPLNLKEERGLSLQDIRSRFVLSGTYNTSAKIYPLLRNIQISTILTLNSGRPFNLLVGTDLDRNGDLAVPSDRPNRIGRNVGRKPGFATFDVRIARRITISEKTYLALYLEAFNLFNRVNINDVNRVFPLGTSGFSLPPKEGGRFVATPDRYISAFAPRQLQGGVRVNF